MIIKFSNATDRMKFKYYDQLPNKTVKFRIHNEQVYKVNTFAFSLYGLYRNSIFNSYSQKEDVAEDIKIRKNEYDERENSKLAENAIYQSPVHHYSVAASLGAMQEWKESKEMKCYVAYKYENGHRINYGFVHFNEQTVNGKKVIYIAQAGVTTPGKGIGKRLMQCVLAHYPANTEFYILTRVFNTEAKILYQEKLSFTPIKIDEIKQLNYDERYCGFKHTTEQAEIDAIKSIQTQEEFEPIQNTIKM